MNEELKPCPFCGGKDLHPAISLGYRSIFCGTCGAYGSKVKVQLIYENGNETIDKHSAVRAWNNRV